MADIEGDSRINRLTGAAEADTVTGLGGADVLLGRGGDDVLYGDDAAFSTPFGFGDDRLSGGDGHDLLVGGAGDDRLTGGSGDDVLIGGFGAAAPSGSAPSYVHPLGRDGGNDSYEGGGGTDLAILTFDRAEGITLQLGDPRRASEILAGGDLIGTIQGVEMIRFFGGAGADVVSGGVLGDVLSGGQGHDTLQGGDGADRVLGGAGNDLLDGGDGFDVLSYEDAAAGVAIDLGRGAIPQNTGGAGIDTLIGFEQVDGSAFSDRLVGSSADDFLSGGSGGNDRLDGGEGNDSFYQYRAAADAATSSVINGGAGDDVATLSAGPDARDRFRFSGGGGNDTVHVSGDGRYDLILGGGDDVVGISLAGASVVARLGGGVDTVVLESRSPLQDGWAVPVIADFAAGDNGDRIDLRAWLSNEAEGFGSDDNPFAGFVRLIAAGSDTLVQVDRDADGDDHAFEAVLRLADAAPQDFTAFNFGGYDPVVAWPAAREPFWFAPPVDGACLA